jgi:hypothetical protein
MPDIDRSAVGQGLQQELPDPVAPAAAHDEHGVAGPDLAGEPRGRRLDRSGAATGIAGLRFATASASPAAEAIVVSGSRPAQMSATATASASARTAAKSSSRAAVRWEVSGS